MTDLTDNQRAVLEKALLTIKKLKAAVHEQRGAKKQAIAIVGISCRFPQAENKQAYWELLKQGKNIITPLPESRWDLLKSSEEFAKRKANYSYPGGYVSDIEKFDANFFGISPREAAYLDPQQRLLLEVTYEALEDAGIPLEKLAGSQTGVFIGFQDDGFGHLLEAESELDALYIPTGNAASIAANRISYQFDLHGPSITIDTACSSSLVAMHLALQAINAGQCEMAIVGGVSLHVLPSINYLLSQAQMLSPDGQCKTFDANANGYVQGEGAGIVILKSLPKALADKDRIYAIIAGSATNQDGRTNGLTAPNGKEQEALLKAAYTDAKVDLANVSYVECHGTGTALGDPIEVEALGNILGKTHNADKPCWLGSVKANIGHLEPAAGIAGIIKTCLSLQAKQITPQINYQQQNPHINLSNYGFQLADRVQAWPSSGEHRIAGVSSFGFGGSNAHVILQEHIENPRAQPLKQPLEIFTLSAKDTDALENLISAYKSYLLKNPNLDLGQLCYNLHMRRTHFPIRLAIIADSIQSLQQKLNDFRPEMLPADVFLSAAKSFSNDATVVADAIAGQDKKQLSELAELYIQGKSIPWQEIEKNRFYPTLDLPFYTWHKKTFWPNFKKPLTMALSKHPLAGEQVHSPLKPAIFQFKLDLQSSPELKDTFNMVHVGYYIEMIGYAVKTLQQWSAFEITDFNFLAPLAVEGNEVITLHVVMEKQSNHWRFQVYRRNQNDWIEHVNGNVQELTAQPSSDKTIAGYKLECQSEKEGADFRQRLKEMGMPTEGSVNWVKQYCQSNSDILAEFRQPKTEERAEQFALEFHPGIFDACIQPVFMLLSAAIKKPYVTATMHSLKVFPDTKKPMFLHSELVDVKKNGQEIKANWQLLDADGAVLVACTGIDLVQISDFENFKKALGSTASTQITTNLDGLNPEERQAQIIQFLLTEAENVFKISKEDIDIEQPLQEMGMNSLMATAIVKQIEVGLGKHIPLEEMLKPISISQVADYIMH